MRRVGVAVLAVLVLTAFAPAPFPRPRRGGGEFTLDALQGRWKSLGLEVVGNDGRPTKVGWTIEGVRVEGDRWTYLDGGGADNASYTIGIDPAKRPSAIDFHSGTRPANRNAARPYMVGVIRREGELVKVLFYTAEPAKRATSFESPPPGWWILTLRKAP